MPASSDRPETMTSPFPRSEDTRGCGCCSNPSSTLLLRLGFCAQCPFWAPIVLLACNFHHIGALSTSPGSAPSIRRHCTGVGRRRARANGRHSAAPADPTTTAAKR